MLVFIKDDDDNDDDNGHDNDDNDDNDDDDNDNDDNDDNADDADDDGSSNKSLYVQLTSTSDLNRSFTLILTRYVLLSWDPTVSSIICVPFSSFTIYDTGNTM